MKKEILVLVTLILFFGGCIFFPDNQGEDDLAYRVILEDNLSEECKQFSEDSCAAFQCMVQDCFCDETYYLGPVLNEKFTVVDDEEHALKIMKDYIEENYPIIGADGQIMGRRYSIDPQRAVKINDAFYNVFTLENGSESVYTVAVDGTIMKTTCNSILVDS